MPETELVLSPARHAQDLRQTWQGRALAHARGQLGAVVLSMLAHSYDEALPVLLRVVFPGFRGIATPFYCSAGKIALTGHVVADLADKQGQIVKNSVVFLSTGHMQSVFRRLADELRLDDADRVALFACVQRWIVCDYRLDPNKDPNDPDARQSVH